MEEEYMRRVGRLLIIPAWYVDSFAHELTMGPSELWLVLNPDQGWGTGSHATTQMCLTLLDTYLKPGDRVFDVGCGSGILSLAAVKFGASSVLAIDIAPEAEQATRENIARNDLADKIEFRLGSLETVLNPQPATTEAPQAKPFKSSNDDQTPATSYQPPATNYQLIVGNIFAYLIIPFLQQGLATLLTSQGYLIVSGIITAEAESVTTALQAAGLTVIEQQTADGWVAIVAQKI